MTKLYLIRHCQTLGNQMQRFQGSTDYPPSEKGEKQLELLKKRFDNTSIDAIYSSPLGRAYKTAEAVRGDKQMDIITMPELKEMDVGVFEDTLFGEYIKTDANMYDIWHNRTHLFAPQGGESAQQVYDRIWQGIKTIVEQNDGKTVAVTSHGFAIRCLLARLLHNDITKLAEVVIPANTSVTLIEFNSDLSFEIKYFDDDSHVDQSLKTTFVLKR